jgi:cytochrome b
MSASADLTGEGGPAWDPLVRLTHWGIAAAILVNGLLTEDGGAWHVWVGWAAFSLLLLRLLWGVLGTGAARFSAFPPSPRGALAHVRDIMAGRHKHYGSHNPAGALMVYALWATLAVVTLTGIGMAGSPFDQRLDGDREAHSEWTMDEEHERDGDGDEALEEVHEAAANLLFLLAAIHVAGVALESRLSHRNLVRPMLTGR